MALANERRRGRDLYERGERGVRARLDDVDHAEQEDRAVAEFQLVTDLDRRRDVAERLMLDLLATLGLTSASSRVLMTQPMTVTAYVTI